MSNIGCLLIHGFTGSPREIELIANHLKQNDVEVETPTLAGHGIELDRKGMSRVNWKDWIKSAEEALNQMQSKYDVIYLVGFSMGGMIAGYLAAKYPVQKLVLLSASVFYVKPKTFIKNLKEKPLNKSQIKRYIEKFKSTPIRATINFRRLVKELTPYIKQIKVPTLILQGEKDDLVDPRSANYIYDTIKSEEKHIHFLPKSKHIICWDCEKDKVLDLVGHFLLEEA